MLPRRDEPGTQSSQSPLYLLSQLLQISAGLLLITVMLFYGVRLNTTASTPRRWGVNRGASLILQLITATLLAANLILSSGEAIKTTGIEPVSLAVHLVSFAAASANIAALVLSRATTSSRLLYDTASCLTWAWLASGYGCNESDQAAADIIGRAIPVVYAASLLLDLAVGTTTWTTGGVFQWEGLLSWATCTWLNPILLSREPLRPETLPEQDLPSDFDGTLQRLIAACASDSSPVRLFLGLLLTNHGRALAFSAGLRLLEDLSRLALPFQLRALLARPTAAQVLLLFCTRTWGAILGAAAAIRLREVAVRVKAVLSASLHRKTLRLGAHRAQGPRDADISTLSEVDSQALYSNVLTIHDLWSYPLQALFVLGALLYLLPWEGVAAVVFFAGIAVPTVRAFTGRIGFFIGSNMMLKDARTRLTSEVLRCMRSIKLHAWESAFEIRLNRARAHEVEAVRQVGVWSALLVGLVQLVPSGLALAAFGAAALRHQGQRFDSPLVFSSIMLFTLLDQALQTLSNAAVHLEVVKTSMGRMREYLARPEEARITGVAPTTPSGAAVELRGVDVQWPGGARLLANCNLVVQQGEMVVLTGATCCGKTSLLQCVLGAARPARGHMRVRGRLAYVSQEPFLIAGTVRENIVFGRPFDADRYHRVLAACALDAELDSMPHGDQWHLDGSPSLSGGQRARVSLARAVYADADVYIIDDPLSAVDVNVRNLLARDVFSNEGMLKRAARLVVSNARALVEEADVVYGVVGGTLVRLGDPRLTQVVTADQPVMEPCEGSRAAGLDIVPSARLTGATSPIVTPFGTPTTIPMVEDAPLLDVSGSQVGPSDAAVLAREAIDADEFTPLIRRPTSVSHFHPIWAFLSYAHGGGWALGLTSLILARLVSAGGTYTLKRLTDETTPADLLVDLALFAGLVAIQTLLFFAFLYTIFTLCILPASRAVHSRLTRAVLRQPLAFFEAVPAGEILNRFTNDLARVDGPLHSSLLSLAGQVANLALALGLLVAAAPAAALFVGPIVVGVRRAQRPYVRRLRAIRRLELATRAPLLTLLQEADRGAVHFRAFGLRQSREDSFSTHLRENMRALLPSACVDIWLCERLEMLTIALQMLALATLVALKIESAVVGFVMTYVFQITTNLAVATSAAASFEADVVALRRVQEFVDMGGKEEAADGQAHEAAQNDPGPARSRSPNTFSIWPEEGRIEFDHFTTRYRPHLPPTLRDISLVIEAGEKVAVVGRTGASKTSLVLALLGLLRATSGRVSIDGADLAELDGVLLRRRLALLPQDPVVFPGTVRENVDPLGIAADEDIRRALLASTAALGLERMVARRGGEGDETATGSAQLDLLDGVLGTGSDLAAGEVQLLAVARALLQRSRILILDEATAGLDGPTEERVHNVLRELFVDTTVVAVMHRLERTMEYDKVLVLANGEVVEYDSPAALMAKSDSVYAAMLAAAGLTERMKVTLREISRAS